MKNLIVEIHRRSLWQVMAIYLGASWGVLEASDQVIGQWVPYADLMSGLAFEQLGEPDSAVAYLERVIEPVRLAGWAFCRLQLPMIELRLARLEESRGDVDAAIRHYRHFLELWAEPDPELQDEVETARRAVARLAGQETP